MKATDLQIGDWVLLDNTYPSTDAKQVQITLQDLVEISQGKESNPIPLTADIMEKNGFVQTEDRSLVKGDIYFQPATNKNYFTDIDHPHISIHPFYALEKVSLRCDYVHILQHIFRLCGLNDLADNLIL